MEIINKSIQLTVKESLLKLSNNDQCLTVEGSRKQYVRGEIRKIQLANPSIKFRTKVDGDILFVWRLT